MQDETTSISLSLHQQIQQICSQLESIAQALEDPSSRDVQQTIAQLTRLTGALNLVARRIAEIEEERRELRALARIGGVVNSSLKLDEVLRIVMDTIIRLTGAERCFLMLKDQNGELQIQIARNWERETIDTQDAAISHTVANRVAQGGEPILTTNAQEDPRFDGQASVVAYSLRSILCVPLKVKDEITGVIYADNRIRAGLFTESDRDLLAAFANQAAVAIENARLFESVQRTLAEVTELKNLMDNVFASIASGVITTDIQHKITLINQAAERILARKAANLLQQPLAKSLPELAAVLEEPIRAVEQANKTIVDMEISPSLPPRGPVHLRFSLSPLRDASQSTQGVAIVVDDITDRKRLEAQRRLFERMVSPAVIEQLNPDELRLGGDRVEITALFADIRGFTHFSESLPPEELVTILNRYLAAAAEAILAQEGTVDKFMGDAVMAWFNAPIPQPDHTLRAVRAALGIRDAIQNLYKELPPERHLSFGVGIHFGEAVLGLVGTEKRLDYTAIGDSVNTAKRIQENARANQILISDTAYQQVKDRVRVRPAAPIHAKGKSHPLVVHEIIGER